MTSAVLWEHTLHTQVGMGRGGCDRLCPCERLMSTWGVDGQCVCVGATLSSVWVWVCLHMCMCACMDK